MSEHQKQRSEDAVGMFLVGVNRRQYCQNGPQWFLQDGYRFWVVPRFSVVLSDICSDTLWLFGSRSFDFSLFGEVSFRIGPTNSCPWTFRQQLFSCSSVFAVAHNKAPANCHKCLSCDKTARKCTRLQEAARRPQTTQRTSNS